MYCIVYMSCFTGVGEGGTGTSGISGSFLQLLVFEEGETLFSVTSALSSQLQSVDWKYVCISFFLLLR